jgi:hypothetical protein
MSITRDQLIQFIEKPELLREQTIGELKEIVDEFPYFQSAQLLYTYNLFSLANFRYAGYLKTCSIYATDRTILYQLLQQHPRQGLKPEPKKPLEKKVQETSALFELAEEKQITQAELPQVSSLPASEYETIDFDLLSFDQTDVFDLLDEPETTPVPADIPQQQVRTDSKEREKVDLIEQFIKINPTIPPRIENIPEHNEHFRSGDEPLNDNDEFITETLSRIYLKQGHYQKAIDSFKRLSLKFPEKSAYFAQQIEEIKKLLN